MVKSTQSLRLTIQETVIRLAFSVIHNKIRSYKRKTCIYKFYSASIRILTGHVFTDIAHSGSRSSGHISPLVVSFELIVDIGRTTLMEVLTVGSFGTPFLTPFSDLPPMNQPSSPLSELNRKILSIKKSITCTKVLFTECLKCITDIAFFLLCRYIKEHSQLKYHLIGKRLFLKLIFKQNAVFILYKLWKKIQR